MATPNVVAMPVPRTFGVRSVVLKSLAPIAVGVALALVPTPAGLAPNAWRFFALFAAVIVALITEPIPAGREGVSAVEAGRGEAIHYVMTGEDARPYRWRVRAPTYANLQALSTSLKGMSIADVPITLGSMDPCFSCTERLQVVDVRSRRVRVFAPHELREMTRTRRVPA